MQIVWKGHAASCCPRGGAASPAEPCQQGQQGRRGPQRYTTARGEACVHEEGTAAGDAASAYDSSGPPGVNLRSPFPPMPALQSFVRSQLGLMREDHLRNMNPTPYKVSVSPDLFHFLHDMWMKEVPILELH